VIELAKLTEPTFSASVMHDATDIVVRFAGTADIVAQKHLDRLFGDVHEQASRLGVARVKVDLRELAFMNSSCIKDVIVWLEKVRKAEESKRYLVAFLSSTAQPWQRRSLHALSHFARGIVSVEVC
jgi:hypothetical protein